MEPENGSGEGWEGRMVQAEGAVWTRDWGRQQRRRVGGGRLAVPWAGEACLDLGFYSVGGALTTGLKRRTV